LVQKFSRIKPYSALTLPILLYDSEIWTLRKQKIKTIDINRDKIFQKSSRAHLLDYKRNEEILEGLKLEPVDEKPRRYNSNWLGHVTRMNKNRIIKIMLNYRTTKTTRKTFDETIRRGLARGG
jgi:hypothetical protein